MKEIIFRIYVALFAHPLFKRFNRFVITLGLKGIGIDNYKTRKLTGEEQFAMWIGQNRLNDVVFDVGANIGEYTKLCIDNSAKKVYCFEPVGNTFLKLNDQFKNDETVSCFNVGLSNVKKKAKIFDKSETGTTHASLYEDAISGQNESLTVTEISLDTLDNFCKQNEIQHINLLKIDTEGHEYSVLEGSMNLLTSSSIDVIHFEFGSHDIYAGKFLTDFRKLLKNYNFYRLLPKGFLSITFDRPQMEEFFFFQNIIAVRKDLNLNL